MSRTIEVLTSFTLSEQGRCRRGTCVRLPDGLAEEAVARGDARYVDGLDRSSPTLFGLPELTQKSEPIEPEQAEPRALAKELDALSYHGADGLLALAKDVAEFIEAELPGRTSSELVAFCAEHETATRLILEVR